MTDLVASDVLAFGATALIFGFELLLAGTFVWANNEKVDENIAQRIISVK